MSARMVRALTRSIIVLSGVLPVERRQWVEALTSEAASVPAGRRRLAWLLGSFAVLIREVGRMLRTVVAALVAVGVLLGVVAWRYPEAVSGAGTPIYGTLLVLLLAGYLVATVRLTRAGTAPMRYGMLAGLVAAVLWTLGNPAGGTYDVSMPWLRVLYDVGLVLAFTVAPVVAAALAVRRTPAVEHGVLAGAVTGMTAALVNLIGGLVLVLVLPGRVPFDSDVLRRHHTLNS
ncbi:MAG: hypothetical protein AUI14_21380 [Actinobacteria bacterium 13_2_20CM_2_71_6]|nr:MAG: hypothetical protein AUI14_21380 [Actinobacteria bacterium 13_2_20CM_2_71_6]